MTEIKDLLDCMYCQPHKEPIIEGSSIEIILCKCISLQDCQCEQHDCHCFTCIRRKRDAQPEYQSAPRHKRQESVDWRELEMQSHLRPLDYKKHSKLCACRGSVIYYRKDMNNMNREWDVIVKENVIVQPWDK